MLSKTRGTAPPAWLLLVALLLACGGPDGVAESWNPWVDDGIAVHGWAKSERLPDGTKASYHPTTAEYVPVPPVGQPVPARPSCASPPESALSAGNAAVHTLPEEPLLHRAKQHSELHSELHRELHSELRSQLHS